MVETSQETWRNVLAGPISVKKLDHRGELTRREIIMGGQTLHITPEERRLNSQDIPVRNQDFFKNGSLVPVKLIDGSDDVREMASSPSLLSEEALGEMLDAQWNVFEAALADIDNPVTIGRLAALAAAHPDCSHRKVVAIQARLDAVTPRGYIEVAAPSGSAGSAAPDVRAVTPR